MKFSHIVLLGAATLAAADSHNHLHKHRVRQISPAEKRDAATVVVDAPAAVETVYELDGSFIPQSEVEEGLNSGKYVVVGEVISTVIPAPPSTSSVAPSSSAEAAEFFQQSSSSSSSSTSTSTSTSSSSSIAPTSSSAAPPKTSSAPPPSSSSSSSGSGSGNVGASFPSGTIPCSQFPSAYGAVAADWLSLGSWTGIQKVPNYNPGTDTSISYIESGVAGDSCTPNSFCSYACPPGYQKSQWPTAQGATGQSIGGLWCNSNGMLELSRPSVPQICMSGAGGVYAQNTLSQVVAICRTDYPGSESETIPLECNPGTTNPVTNPSASNYYTWEGSSTSAQYYINPAGATVAEACQWGSAGTNLGNWAPVNMGVGQSTSGETFISLFPNAPTNPDGKLNFNIKITGGVSGSCSYEDGVYYNNGAPSSTGCTVSVSGTATFVFS